VASELPAVSTTTLKQNAPNSTPLAILTPPRLSVPSRDHSSQLSASMSALKTIAITLCAASAAALMVPCPSGGMMRASTVRPVETLSRPGATKEAERIDVVATDGARNNVMPLSVEMELDVAAQDAQMSLQTFSELIAGCPVEVEPVEAVAPASAVVEAVEAAPLEVAEAVEVSDLDEFLIKWGFKDDPRIPEDERVDAMTRIKNSGRAGIVAYAITEGGFWLSSGPFAFALLALTTGEIPDINTDEGKQAIGSAAFILINFARLIVPARIALALGLAPWVDENLIQRFGGDAEE